MVGPARGGICPHGRHEPRNVARVGGPDLAGLPGPAFRGPVANVSLFGMLRSLPRLAVRRGRYEPSEEGVCPGVDT